MGVLQGKSRENVIRELQRTVSVPPCPLTHVSTASGAGPGREPSGEQPPEQGRRRGRPGGSHSSFPALRRYVVRNGGRGGSANPHAHDQTVENQRMYCLMPSDNFIVKKSAGIEPTTFGVPTHCSNH